MTDVLQKALDDRQAHPWRYYQLDREVLTKMLEEQAKQIEGLRERIRQVEAEKGPRP